MLRFLCSCLNIERNSSTFSRLQGNSPKHYHLENCNLLFLHFGFCTDLKYIYNASVNEFGGAGRQVFGLCAAPPLCSASSFILAIHKWWCYQSSHMALIKKVNEMLPQLFLKHVRGIPSFVK